MFGFESNLLCKIIGFIHLINNQLYKSKYLTIFKRLGSHSVLALIALIVIGGATRVMEADLPVQIGHLLWIFFAF